MTPTTQTISTLDQALHYARERGWAVFPLHSITLGGNCTCNNTDCTSPGKHPVGSLVPNGVSQATKDENQIKSWFGAMGAYWANIGIATGKISNLIVVDLDFDKGADYIDLVLDWDFEVSEITNTVTVRTGGGVHLYYKAPGGTAIKNSQSRLGRFIDIRGEGGYVVAPPSKHVSGKIYEFVDETEHLLDFPEEWANKLSQPTAAPANSQQNGNGGGVVIPPPTVNQNPDAVIQGNRNATFASLAGKMRHYGFGQKAIEDALLAENERICQPPMTEKEVRDIARKIAQNYQPSHDLTDPNIVPPDTDDDTDYENTLKPYLFGDFLEIEFEEKEILGFHIGKRDIAIIQAATNAGKTTLLRNVGLCMAAGREFMPFYEGSRPIKIAYFDFESDAQDVQRDLKIMFDVFNDRERENIKKNLIVIPKGLMGGELFQFNTHEKWANSLIQQNAVEFIFVDNVSAAYDLNDENSNAEVTKKVIKPLLKMAYTNNAAFLFAHHYGKGKPSEIEAAGVHAGRGASALQALSRTVINMFGDVSKGEPLTIECAKRKVDGGQNYRQVFKLDPDRWFYHTTIAPPPPKRTAYQTLREFMEGIVYPAVVSTADVISHFEDEYNDIHIKKALAELYKDGFIEKPKHGFYCAKELRRIENNDA